LTVAGIFFAAQSAEAYQIKRVIRGQVNMGSTEIVSTDLEAAGLLGSPVTYIDTTKAFVLITQSTASDRRVQKDAFAVLDDEKTLTIVRYGTVTTIVEYMIVEFVSGVTVTSGLTVFPDGTATVARQKTITLPQSVDLTKTFALVSWKAYTGSNVGTDENYQYNVTFTDVNKLFIRRTDSTSSYFSDVYYQVIEFDEDVFVQSGSAQIISPGTPPAGETRTVNGHTAPTY
jgi:hypothetical protein